MAINYKENQDEIILKIKNFCIVEDILIDTKYYISFGMSMPTLNQSNFDYINKIAQFKSLLQENNDFLKR